MKRQCTATAKSTRKRCERSAIRGGTVCPKHGGGAPQVKRKARERLNDLVDPAINQLDTRVSDKKNPSLALRAATDILDRAGFKPTDKVEHFGHVIARIVDEIHMEEHPDRKKRR